MEHAQSHWNVNVYLVIQESSAKVPYVHQIATRLEDIVGALVNVVAKWVGREKIVRNVIPILDARMVTVADHGNVLANPDGEACYAMKH